ncbi:uncharacterized protein LTR77_001661 [Saxophila tyrrhenica]|uniref:Uncharacterized protein n=1 Tax=Saxophila tyrrhenica TaxID=1690608 RepID=A0AAV9PKW4_9PEZI|nr:hypothetical protein LTR77_001661 [Saxophila tyrrhenica]
MEMGSSPDILLILNIRLRQPEPFNQLKTAVAVSAQTLNTLKAVHEHPRSITSSSPAQSPPSFSISSRGPRPSTRFRSSKSRERHDERCAARAVQKGTTAKAREETTTGDAAAGTKTSANGDTEKGAPTDGVDKRVKTKSGSKEGLNAKGERASGPIENDNWWLLRE